MTRSHFDGAGVDNLLYAYSPDLQGPGEIYMERYPGDDLVDLLGLDGYTATTQGWRPMSPRSTSSFPFDEGGCETESL